MTDLTSLGLMGSQSDRMVIRELVDAGDMDVRYLAGLETPVASSDEVRLLPAMAGG